MGRPASATGVVAGNPSVTRSYNVTIAVARNIDCQVQRSPTLILGVFRLHQIAHVGVSLHTGPKLFGREIIFQEFQPT